VEFGAGTLSDIAGIVTYNMVVERNPAQHNRFVFPHKVSDIEAHIRNMAVYTGSGTKFAAAIHATMDVLHLCQIRDMYFAFESGPIVEAGGDFFVPLSVGAIVTGSDPFTQVGTVVIMYNHPARHFSINADVNTSVIGISVFGNINLQWNPKLFGIYVGYPEMLRAEMSIGSVLKASAGVGAAFQVGEKDGKRDSFVAARIGYDYRFNADIWIVYISGNLSYGASGEYHFGGVDQGKLNLDLYLKGGMKGGIWFFGRRDIINFYLDAMGSLYTSKGKPWHVEASCEVRFSIDLFLASISDSVRVDFGMDLG